MLELVYLTQFAKKEKIDVTLMAIDAEKLVWGFRHIRLPKQNNTID